MAMLTTDSSPVDRAAIAGQSGRARIKPWFYALVIPAVLVVVVIMMALQDGTNGALVTVFVVAATGATAVGLWGTAMAVRDTHDFGPRPDGERSSVMPVHTSSSSR